jgi:hypothetical protein
MQATKILDDSVLAPKCASTEAANSTTKVKHFYKPQTSSDVRVIPPLVINNFPFFPAFHSLQLNAPGIRLPKTMLIKVN